MKQLQQEHDVGRDTVLRAVEILRNEGLVFTVPRWGTYVSPLFPRVTPLVTSCLADADAKDTGGTHPDEVRRYILDPRLKPGIDERRALGLGIQMMCRSPRQHDPPLVCLQIDLVDLHGDLVVGVRNTGAQVLVKDGVPRAQDN